MAKVIKEEELTIILKLKREDGTGQVTVEARADYKKEYDNEHEVSVSLSDVTITSQQETAIKNFGAQVLQ